MQKNLVKTDFRLKLEPFFRYAGPHPVEDDGWQVVYDFGKVQVSIAYTPFTQGVEIMLWGLWVKPLTYVTPALVRFILERLVCDE